MQDIIWGLFFCCVCVLQVRCPQSTSCIPEDCIAESSLQSTVKCGTVMKFCSSHNGCVLPCNYNRENNPSTAQDPQDCAPGTAYCSQWVALTFPQLVCVNILENIDMLKKSYQTLISFRFLGGMYIPGKSTRAWQTMILLRF